MIEIRLCSSVQRLDARWSHATAESYADFRLLVAAGNAVHGARTHWIEERHAHAAAVAIRLEPSDQGAVLRHLVTPADHQGSRSPASID